eukprot:XP_003723902.1 PREDICTED: zinc finger protein 2-like [Strongylocentrotus purpuratus]
MSGITANQPVSCSPPGQLDTQTGRTSVGDGHGFGSSTEEQNSQDSCAGVQLHAPALNSRRTPPDWIPCEPPYGEREAPGASTTMMQESQVALQDLDGPSTQETEENMVSNTCERTPDQKPWIIENKGKHMLMPQREKHSGGIKSISHKSRVSIFHPEDLLSRDGKKASALERRYFYGSQASDTNHLMKDGLGARQFQSQHVSDANPRSPANDMVQVNGRESLDVKPSTKGVTMIRESGIAVHCQVDLVSKENKETNALEGTSCQRPQNHCASAMASLNEEEQLSQCKICLKSSIHLKSHMKVHTSERPFKCSVCDKGFIERRHLKSHMRSHTGEKPFACSVCQKAFSQPTHLTYHLRTHTGIKPFSCETCGRSFGRKRDLTVHMRIHTGERPFACKLCDKTCSTQRSLTLHMRGHTGERPYSCTVCPKTYTSKSNLIKHVRMHTGEKPYQCWVCHKEFRAGSDLTYHLRTHTGIRPFSCETCGRSFSRKGDLTVHMRIHTGERPFACKLCDKTCRTRRNLTVHMRVHTRERPYSCTVCCKTYRWKSDLTKHVRMHTGEKPYKCGVCLKEFSSDRYLPKHVCAPKTTNMTTA